MPIGSGLGSSSASTVAGLFAINQFVFIFRFYYEEPNLFQAIAMAFFVLAQFLLTQYMLYTERQRNRYLIVNKLNEVV